MVEDKDVVLALVGASAGLAGFALVFLGLVTNTLESFDSDTPTEVLTGYKVLASAVGLAFLAGVATAVLGVWWLVGSHPTPLYHLSVLVFAAQLALLVSAAVWTLVMLVWKKG